MFVKMVDYVIRQMTNVFALIIILENFVKKIEYK